MATPDQLSNSPRKQRKPPPTWSDLERGLAATLPALGSAHLVIATKEGNRFVQFAADPEEGLRAETVSDEYLEPEDRHTDEQTAALVTLGWNAPTHASDAAPDDRVKGGSPNWFRDWAAPAVPWEEVARTAVETLRTIGVSEPAALEYTAWDDANRPLSLPALRLAAGKVKEPARSARHGPKSRPSKAGKRDKVSPAVKEARAKLLSAVRVFQVNNSLQYNEDGQIPIRIGASGGWARLVEQPLLVKVYCQLASGVSVTESLLRRLHEINADWFLVRLILVGSDVYAAVDLPAEPFCVEHFTSACSALLAMDGDHGEELRGKVKKEKGA